MPVRTIKAEINGQVRTITADIPDGALNEDIMAAVEAYVSQPQPAAPSGGPTSFVDSILRGSPGAQIPGRRQRGPVPTVRLNSSPWEQAQLKAQEAQIQQEAQRIEKRAVGGTTLPPEEEAAFQRWYRQYSSVTGNDPNPDATEHFYDYRGFYQSDKGQTPLQKDMHLPDTFKLPGHPTFSDQSLYATGSNRSRTGKWDMDFDSEKSSFQPPRTRGIEGPAAKEILNQAAGQELQDQANQMRGIPEATIPKAAIEFAAAVPGAMASPFKWDPMDARNPVNRVKAAMYASADDPEGLVRELEKLPESDRPAVLKQAVQGLQSDFQGGLANYVEPAKEGEPGTDTAAKAFARTIYGMASPQAMLEMTGLGLAGKATRAAANAPAVVKALANSPRARQAMAVAGEVAVPGGMAIKTGSDAIQAGQKAANAATDTERTDKLTEAITSALMSAGLLAGAVKGGSTAAGEFVGENAGTVGRRRRLSRDAQEAIAQAYGGGFDPTRVDPATAIRRAADLRARGSNLAADDILAKSDPGTQTFKIAGETYQLAEIPTEGGRTAAQITNAKGEVVFGGTPGQAFAWLSQRIEPTVAPGVGPATVEAARGVEVNAKAPVNAVDPVLAEKAKANPGKMKLGIIDEADTAGRGNYSVPVQYAIVDAGLPVASHDNFLVPNPEYPQDAQPRDRERKSSEEQINNITDPEKFRPNRLGYSVMSFNGAPLLGTDMVVESGNGRTIALRRIYQSQPEQAEQYKNWLRQKAPMFGLSAEDVDGIQNPMLVRFRTGSLPEGIDRQQFAIDANADDKAGLSATEQAQIDARYLTPEMLSIFKPDEGGRLDTIDNQDFIRAFREAAVRPNEAGDFQASDGTISKNGINRIRNAIFMRAYGDPSAVEKLAEDPDKDIGNIINGMMSAAPRAALLQSDVERGVRHDLGIGNEVTKVAQKISSLRRRKQNIEDYLAQQDLEGRDPVEQGLMEVFHEFRRSGKRIGQVLRGYLDAVDELGDPNQGSMFGFDLPSKLDILNGVVNHVRTEAEAERLAKANGSQEGQDGGAPVAESEVPPAESGQPTADPETRVLDFLKSNPGTVTGQRLRAALPDIPEQELSNVVSKLRGEDRIIAATHSDPYGAAQSDGSILDPNRKDGDRPIYYAGISFNPDWKSQASKPVPQKSTRSGRIRGVRQLLKDRGAMSIREIAEATGSEVEQVANELRKLHEEGSIELIPAGGPEWAEPQTEMIEAPDGTRYVGARPVLAKTKPVRGKKKGEKGAVTIDFLTGWNADDEPTTPKFEFKNKTTEDRFRSAGQPTPPKEQFFGRVQDLIQMFGRVYRHLPQGKYPALVFELKRLEKAQSIASQKAQEHLRRITAGLDTHQFDAYRKKVIMDDLYETLMQFVRDMKLKLPLEYDNLGNDTIRIPLDALAKSAGKDKADPKNVAQLKLSWETGTAPAVIDGTYSDRNGQIVTSDADFVDAARAAKLSHVDVKLSNMQSMLDDQAAMDRDITFAFGQTFDEIRENLRDVSAFAEKDPKIVDALKKRKDAWDNVRRDLINAFREAGVDIEDRLNRQDYYRHRVLQNIQQKVAQMQSGGGGVYTPRGRSYLKARGVNALDYSTNYIESEYEVLTQMIADTAKAKMVGFLRNPVNGMNIIGKLKDEAAKINQAAIVEEFAKKGLSAPDVFTWANWRRSSLVETLAEAAASGELTAPPRFEKLRQELADAWMRHIENDRPIRLESPTEEYVQYVGWLRAQDAATPVDLSVAMTPTENAIRRALKILGRPNRISERMLKEVLQHRYVDWEDLVPETHAAWNPDAGNTYFMVNSIPETIAREILEKAGQAVGVTSDDLKRVLAVGARREPLVVPREVAATLDDLRTVNQKNPLTQFWKRIMGGWKRWQLISPGRLFMYNLRNMTGDLEASTIGNPRAITKIFQAAKELWNWYRNRVATPELTAWMERGGFQSGLTIQELEDLGNDKHFRKLMEIDGQLSAKPRWNPLNWWFENVAAPASEFREGLLRYSNFLSYREQMQKSGGRPDNFGASRPSDVMALKDVNDRAYKLSNDLLGAYDEITEGGHMLRDNLIPFWSFQELNFRRYKWLLKNAMRDGQLASTFGRSLMSRAFVGAPMLALRFGASMFKILFGFWALTMAWNYLFFRDEENSLPASIRQVPHVVLGKTASGNVVHWSRLGNMPDLLEWLDIGENSPYFHDWLDGRINGGQLAWLVAKHQMSTPLEKIITTSVPQVTIPLQYYAGTRFYPDLSNPRSIRDRNAYVADQLQLRWAYDFLAGKPMGPDSDKLLKLVRSEFARESDPLESAYYDVKDLRREFYRRRGTEEYVPGQSNDPKKDAAYNLKLSVRRGDEKAFRKFLTEYYAAGGTRESLERAAKSFHPLDRMKPEEKRAFVESLQGEDRHRLVLAVRFYQEVFEKGGRLQQYLRQNSDVRPGRVKTK